MLSAATEMRSILYSSLTLALWSLSLLPPFMRPLFRSPRSFSLSLSRHSSYPSTVRSCLPRASTRSSLRGFSLSPLSLALQLRVSFIPQLLSLPSQTLPLPFPSLIHRSSLFTFLSPSMLPFSIPLHLLFPFAFPSDFSSLTSIMV